MPLTSGLNIHDDTKHKGSAKRGAVNGIASLDAAGDVVEEPASKGAVNGVASLDAAGDVVEEPASKGAVNGVASLDAAGDVVEEPASKGAVNGVASLDAAGDVVEEPASKGAVNGIAPLDAGSKVPVANLPDMLPTGTMLVYGAAAAPSGYLLCNGAAVSRTTYAALFAIIADVYGVGDGSTTFNLPDMVGNVPVGIGGSGLTNCGDTTGVIEHCHMDGIQLGETTEVLDELTGGSSDYWKCTNMQPSLGTQYIIKT